MANTWQDSFAQLQGFIKDNPSIDISDTCIAIPGDVRPEFYRLFDIVRTDFLKDNFPSSLEKGYELSKEFARIYKEAIATGDIEAISVRAAVNWFLQDPINGLMRSLFDPVFDLIRGKLTEQAFSKNSLRLIDETNDDYFRHGYECWVALGLRTLMQPDKNYHVSCRDFHTDSEVGEGSPTPGMREEPVDEITESKKITFEGSSITTFIVPRTLFHTKRLGRYASIHTDFTEAHWRARNKSENVEWLEINSLIKEFGRARLWPDLLVYTADDTEMLHLVADFAWVARPDIIVEIEEEDGWYEKGGLENARRHIAALQPRLGCFIVCRTAPPAEAYDEIAPKPPVAPSASTEQTPPDPNSAVTDDDPMVTPQTNSELAPPPAGPFLRIIYVGYDFKKLDPIVEALETNKATPDR